MSHYIVTNLCKYLHFESCFCSSTPDYNLRLLDGEKFCEQWPRWQWSSVCRRSRLGMPLSSPTWKSLVLAKKPFIVWCGSQPSFLAYGISFIEMGRTSISKQMWNDVWLCRSMCTCFDLDLFPHCFCKDVEPDGKLVHQFSRSTSGRRWVTWLDSGVFSWAPSTASNFHLWFQGWQPFHLLVFLLEHYDSKAHSWCLCDCCCKHWAESPFGAA